MKNHSNCGHLQCCITLHDLALSPWHAFTRLWAEKQKIHAQPQSSLISNLFCVSLRTKPPTTDRSIFWCSSKCQLVILHHMGAIATFFPVTTSTGRVWAGIWNTLHLSSFSTQHAQRCVPARSVVTQWVCYPENHVNAFFWIKEMHWRRWGLPGTQNRTAAANAFFPVHKSSSQLVFLNSCLNYCCLRNCLRHGVKPRSWARGTPPVQRPPGPAPMPEAAENTPTAENCLSSSSSISSSSSCSEALVSCRKRFVNRKKCIRHWGSVLSPG